MTETQTAESQPPPMLAVEPTYVDLGDIEQGSLGVLGFTVANEGGPPPPGAELRVAPREPWLRISDVRYECLSPTEPFPVYLELTIETDGLEANRSYDGLIDVWLDEET